MSKKPRFLRLSVSKAKTYKQCKRKFYYQYILKIPTELKVYNAIGSLVHYVLELAFKEWIKTDYKADLQKLIAKVWGSCRDSKEWKDAVSFDVIDEAKAYILGYYKKYVEEQSVYGKPIRCEPRFHLPLQIGSDLKAVVLGYIDRIDRVDYKTLLVLDYKTTNKTQYLDNFQLGIYAAACLYGPYRGYNIDAAYVLLKHDMKLKRMKNPTERHIGEVEKMVKIAKEMDRTVHFDEDYEPTFTKLCDYCDFRDRCYKDTGGPNKVRLTEVGEGSW